jgi:hypothetical protein
MDANATSLPPNSYLTQGLFCPVWVSTVDGSVKTRPESTVGAAMIPYRLFEDNNCFFMDLWTTFIWKTDNIYLTDSLQDIKLVAWGVRLRKCQVPALLESRLTTGGRFLRGLDSMAIQKVSSTQEDLCFSCRQELKQNRPTSRDVNNGNGQK